MFHLPDHPKRGPSSKFPACFRIMKSWFGICWRGVLQDSVIMVRDLFRSEDQTEFIIATIPTMLGVNESARLIKALRKERIPCSKIVVNQA